MNHNIVLVDWDDAFIETDDFTRKEARKIKPVRRYTVGFFVNTTDQGIVLATDKYHKKKDGFAASMFIPWGMVNEWYDL